MAKNCFPRRLYTNILAISLLLLITQSCGLVDSHVIEHLPGFDGPLPFHLEAGYIGVDGDEVQLFYYFIESENTPKEDPLMLMMSGGPGCSAISALMNGMGPLQFVKGKYNESLPALELNPHSWTKYLNIIFIDLPVGAGYSYSQTARGAYTGDYKSSRNADEFLRMWLIDHPQFLSNSIYLSGGSYCGRNIPLFFEDMSQGNEQGTEPYLNLEGYVLGNPLTDDIVDKNSRIPFANGMGLISNELYQSLQKVCDGKYYDVEPTNIACIQKLETFFTVLSGLNSAMILEPNCGPDAHPIRRLMHRLDDSPHIISQIMRFNQNSCGASRNLLPEKWANDRGVQEALHVREGTISEWVKCNYAHLNYTFDIDSSVPYHARLSAKGYRSLIFSGDHDLKAPFLGTQAWIKSLNYSIVDDWRQWTVDDQIAGYTRTYSNKMTFATIKGAGHLPPQYKPKECVSMINRWILGMPL